MVNFSTFTRSGAALVSIGIALAMSSCSSQGQASPEQIAKCTGTVTVSQLGVPAPEGFSWTVSFEKDDAATLTFSAGGKDTRLTEVYEDSFTVDTELRKKMCEAVAAQPTAEAEESGDSTVEWDLSPAGSGKTRDSKADFLMGPVLKMIPESTLLAGYAAHEEYAKNR
ncbi:hypothetical protein ACRQEF_05630 [Actinotignum sp. GS-2025a]|uniref:hypothetical protein n=1 Tax=Actinotignum TaxID=1653174 RepID=UPI000F7F0DE6|nr:hypothetical protein [Actinotignum sanguinis]MDY5147905.1 hypothetical protein [Actinotignum sanguinis]RTE48330.1 hypothetical protein DDD64_07055 [Actinotignum sanguinis]